MPQQLTTMPLLQVWDNLDALAKINPVSGNLDGEYLTMLSKVGKPAVLCIARWQITLATWLLRSSTVHRNAPFSFAPARLCNSTFQWPAG